MRPANTLVLLLAALTLVHATQDAAHYALPPNIYDNIPAGLVTPSSFKTYPTPAPPAPAAPAPVAPVSQRNDDGFILPPGSIASPTPLTTGPTGFDITTPLLNAIYTPGSAFMMTWSNRETAFPDSWTPPQSILDMITQEANFSGNPLLTKEDMRNLAMIKVQGLRAARMASVIKDSQSFLLKSLRLISWPLGDGGIDGSSSSAGAGAGTATTSGLSPKILSDPGFNLLNINHLNHNNSNSSYNSARLNILGSAGGALLWTIPADWEYEGEFEIEIPLPPSSSSPIPGQHTSRSFWILRDAMTRQLNPQFNLPSMDQQQETLSVTNGTIKAKAEAQRQRDMGVFLGVAAMMSAFVLVGLGLVVGMYRRKWAAAAAATRGSPLPPLTPSETGAGNLSNDMHLESAACCTRPTGDNNNNSADIQRRATTGSRNQYAEYTSSSARILTANQKRQSLLLEPLQGDEDAYSPRDLNLSEETLRGVVVLDDAKGIDEDMDEKSATTAIVEVEGGGDNSSSTSTLGGA
ncbi:hypothetical protein BGX24_005103, partial [Mortierella sp. AD032]